jgi:hypothetical protein
MAVGDFDDGSPTSQRRGRRLQGGYGVVQRHQVRLDAETEHAQTAIEVVLPQRYSPLGKGVPAEHVVDEDVEASVSAQQVCHQPAHLPAVRVVDDARLTGPARGPSEFGGLLDGLRLALVGRSGDAAATPRGEHVEPGPGQLDRDRATGSPSRTGHQGHP